MKQSHIYVSEIFLYVHILGEYRTNIWSEFRLQLLTDYKISSQKLDPSYYLVEP